jgi:hypothetical protein
MYRENLDDYSFPFFKTSDLYRLPVMCSKLPQNETHKKNMLIGRNTDCVTDILHFPLSDIIGYSSQLRQSRSAKRERYSSAGRIHL